MDRVKHSPRTAGWISGSLALMLPLFTWAGDLEDRVSKLERMMQSQGLVEMHSQLELLQAEVRNLRGELELQAHNMEQLQNRQRELYLDIDRRLRQLEVGGGSSARPAMPPATTAPPPPATTTWSPAPATTAPPPPATATPSPAPARGTGDPARERADYEEALNILREGRYQQATAAYQKFLSDYPGSSYADNAQYWLAESSYVTREFDTALTQFQQVISAYPDSGKIPDARLKIGYILYEKSDWPGARRELETVAREFPDSTAARLAQDRLDRMRKEGH